MAISKHKPPEGLYLEGRFNGGFLALRVWGLIFGGAYTNYEILEEGIKKLRNENNKIVEEEESKKKIEKERGE